jgi:hypothetical protein
MEVDIQFVKQFEKCFTLDFLTFFNLTIFQFSEHNFGKNYQKQFGVLENLLTKFEKLTTSDLPEICYADSEKAAYKIQNRISEFSKVYRKILKLFTMRLRKFTKNLIVFKIRNRLQNQ